MKICIDMDGVLTDFVTDALKEVKKKFDIDIKYEDVYGCKMGALIYANMTQETKDKYSIFEERDVYRYMCPKGFFRKLKGLPGAVAAVKKLIKAGHHVIFLTKPLEWKYSASDKDKWLDKKFNTKGDRPYSLIMIDKIEDKKLIDADVFVDDDIRVLSSVPLNAALCIEQPWNKEFREKQFEGRTFPSLADATKWILKNAEWLSLPDNGGINASEGK